MNTVIYHDSREISVPKEILDAVKIKPGSNVTTDDISRIQEEYFRIEMEKKRVVTKPERKKLRA